MAFSRLTKFFALSLVVLAMNACASSSVTEQGSTGDLRSDSGTQLGTASTEAVPPSGWAELAAIGKRVSEFGGDMSSPNVAVNDHGDAIAAWSSWSEDADPPSPHLFVAIYRNHAWQPAVELVDHHARDASVQINDRGDMIVSYVRVVHLPQGQGWSEEVWARRFVNGSWEDAVRVGFESPEEALMSTYVGALQVKLSATGQALLVWRQSDTRTPSVHEGLFASYLGLDGWSAPVKLDQTLPSYVDAFWVDLNAQGQGAVLWLDDPERGSGDETKQQQRRVLWSRSMDQGSWGSTIPVHEASQADPVDHGSPRVAVDDQGRAYAVYTQGQAGTPRKTKVQFVSLDRGGSSWSAPELLLANAGVSLSLETGIAVGQDGHVAAGWKADSATHPEYSSTFLRVFDRDRRTWGDVLELSPHPSGVQTAPLLSVDQEGRVWTAWRQSDADPKASIHVRSFGLDLGLGEVQTPANGESLALAGNRTGQVFLVTRHHYISQDPLGYYSAPAAVLFTP